MTLQPKDAELFIGIVARIGVDTKAVTAAISYALGKYDYDTVEIKITDAIKELPRYRSLPATVTTEKYKSYIRACNEIRKATSHEDIMARFAVSQIWAARGETRLDTDILVRRVFVINQLKRPEESELLREIYGEHYVQISFHAHHDQREHNLAQRIADDHPEKPRGEHWRTAALELIDRDEAEEDDRSGQRVRDVFPLSDVVIDATDTQSTANHLGRFFRALFGDSRVTPTIQEYGMQLANTASLRSSDLSRQVGAAILNKHAEIQALGCNEVPKAGGGTYWESDNPDSREFRLGRDSNDERKRETLLDLSARMITAGIIPEEYKDNNLLKKKLFEREDDIISNSQLMDSLEYGRTVHAEMNAITDAARGGHAIRDCILYCNTFPCHNCAKHIVASGVRKVVYLRPFPKSYARQLFSDSIAVDPAVESKNQVAFTQFVGIVGPIYERLFSKGRWKLPDGSVGPFVKKGAAFIRRTPVASYLKTESLVLAGLKELLDANSLMQPDTAENPAD